MKEKKRHRKQPECRSTGEWTKKLQHIFNGTLLSHKKHKMTLFAAAWVDTEIILLSELSQTEKDEDHTLSLTCGM